MNEHLPSDYQRAMWWEYIDSSMGPDEEGNWLGWCPLHDRARRDTDVPSAWFNFKHGVLKCLGEPSCHRGQRAMSLNNVVVQMTKTMSGEEALDG